MGRPPHCEAAGIDNQGRILARCQVEIVDMSCAMLATKYAEPSQTACNRN